MFYTIYMLFAIHFSNRLDTISDNRVLNEWHQLFEIQFITGLKCISFKNLHKHWAVQLIFFITNSVFVYKMCAWIGLDSFASSSSFFWFLLLQQNCPLNTLATQIQNGYSYCNMYGKRIYQIHFVFGLDSSPITIGVPVCWTFYFYIFNGTTSSLFEYGLRHTKRKSHRLNACRSGEP